MEKNNWDNFYNDIPSEFYENFIEPNKSTRAWFHKARYKRIQEWINQNYSSGKIIVDIGCGSCAWNKEKLPVIGIDIHKSMLELAKTKKNIKEGILSDAYKIRLPDNSADIIILSEVIEHLENPRQAIAEAERILKPNGAMLITVPYDTLFSLWFYLFNIECIVLGYILRKPFYQKWGGHIQHFSPKSIRKMIRKTKLKIIKQENMFRMTIFTTCKKLQEP